MVTRPRALAGNAHVGRKGSAGGDLGHPHDDTVRLAYADWLDEHGQPGRAEFVRVQIELAQLSEWDDGYETLKARATELLKVHGTEWRANVPKKWAASPFHRGFLRLDFSGLKFEKMIQLTVRQLQLAPLARFHYYLPAQHFDAFLAWPGVVFQELFAPRPPLSGDWLARLTRCERLRNASEVAFICERRSILTADEVRVILDTWANRHLTTFWITAGERDAGDQGGDDAAFTVMAGHPALAKARRLVLRKNRPTTAGLRALGHSPHLSNVRALDLWQADVGSVGLIELCRSPLLPVLRDLGLSTAGIGDEGVATLANTPGASNLRALNLQGNAIGPDGFRALARSPYLGGLLALDVSENPMHTDAAATAELRVRFGRAVRFHT